MKSLVDFLSPSFLFGDFFIVVDLGIMLAMASSASSCARFLITKLKFGWYQKVSTNDVLVRFDIFVVFRSCIVRW